MKISIENIGKIEKSEIEVKGITLIAGKNDTGKSTIGKVLYSTYLGLSLGTNSFLSIEKQKSVISELSGVANYLPEGEIKTEIIELVNHGHPMGDYHPIFASNPSPTKNLFSRIEQIINRILETNPQGNLKKAVTLTKLKLDEPVDSKRLRLNQFLTVFKGEFYENITSKRKENQKSRIKLTEEAGSLELSLNDIEIFEDESDISLNVNFLNPIMIDNPFVIDEVNSLSWGGTEHLSHTKRLMFELIDLRVNRGNPIDKQVLTKEMSAILDTVLPGRTVQKDHYNYYQAEDNVELIHGRNLSTGMKSFELLKTLLVGGRLTKTSIIILDEPEIHLHPEWQLKYAELIVILQKTFPIRFLITSHSPFFIEAIELFSRKYKIHNDLKMYRSLKDADKSTFEDVTDNSKLIYRDLASAIITLDELREDILYD